MMISRRPYRRASSEYAPGPRHKTAIAITPVNAAEILTDEFNRGTGIRARATPRAIRVPKLLASQLNSPNRSNSPHITESVATSRVNIPSCCRERRQLTPAYRSVTPTVARNSISPIPGTPSGKIGKVERCVSIDNSWQHKQLLPLGESP